LIWIFTWLWISAEFGWKSNLDKTGKHDEDKLGNYQAAIKPFVRYGV